MKRLLILISVLATSASFGQSGFPQKGFVPDSATAIALAKTFLSVCYGPQLVKHQGTFTAERPSEDPAVWLVHGEQKEPGRMEIRIRVHDGGVTSFTRHYKQFALTYSECDPQ